MNHIIRAFSAGVLFFVAFVASCVPATESGARHLDRDAGGGIIIGSPTSGLVAVKSDKEGFAVYNDDESSFAFHVDNNYGWVRSSYPMQVKGSPLAFTDVMTFAPTPTDGVMMASVGGALRVAQKSPPTIAGSRGNGDALRNLLAELAAQGLILDRTTP
jgi:hypothetical protein